MESGIADYDNIETILPLGHFLFIAASLCASVHAFSTSTGSCAAGDLAINGDPHISALTIITGSLEFGGFSDRKSVV